jgi:hypothetical protein
LLKLQAQAQRSSLWLADLLNDLNPGETPALTIRERASR